MIVYFRALAKRHLTIDLEHSDLPAPAVSPGVQRMTIRFDLEERKPRSHHGPEPKEEAEE